MSRPRWFPGLRRAPPTARAAGTHAGEDIFYTPALGALRVVAIGDIHGRADLLAALHLRLDAEATETGGELPVEIYLGDYIDRGPRSREVIDMLLARRRIRRLVCLMGNHERMLLQAMNDPGEVEAWMRLGGGDTLRSYGLTPRPTPHERSIDAAIARTLREGLPADHLAFFHSLTLSFAIGGLFFVHAGVRPGVALNAQREDDLLWIRDEFLNSEADHGALVVHGHTPVPAADFRRNRINIDTGAVFTGVLTGLLISDTEIRFV